VSRRPPFVSPVRVARAYEQLAAEIRGRILSGELAPGVRLPSETALATEAGVSRSTVREALRTLEEGGFLERVSPRILIVRQTAAGEHVELTRVMRRTNVSFRHLHEALLVLEPELTRLATMRADALAIEALEANLEAQVASLADFDQWSRLDQDFHLKIAEISGNPALVLARAPVSDLLMPVLHRFMVSTKLTRRALTLHERILEEIRAGDPEAAALMTRKHVDDFRAGWERAGLRLDLAVHELEERDIVHAGQALSAAL
jgi:GntR family transcriptional repressor for pyruvate dehydrogenase complex